MVINHVHLWPLAQFLKVTYLSGPKLHDLFFLRVCLPGDRLWDPCSWDLWWQDENLDDILVSTRSVIVPGWNIYPSKGQHWSFISSGSTWLAWGRSCCFHKRHTADPCVGWKDSAHLGDQISIVDVLISVNGGPCIQCTDTLCSNCVDICRANRYPIKRILSHDVMESTSRKHSKAENESNKWNKAPVLKIQNHNEWVRWSQWVTWRDNDLELQKAKQGYSCCGPVKWNPVLSHLCLQELGKSWDLKGHTFAFRDFQFLAKNKNPGPNTVLWDPVHKADTVPTEASWPALNWS